MHSLIIAALLLVASSSTVSRIANGAVNAADQQAPPPPMQGLVDPAGARDSDASASASAARYNPDTAMRALWYVKSASCNSYEVSRWTCPTCNAHVPSSNLAWVAAYDFKGLKGFVGYDEAKRQIVVSLRTAERPQQWIDTLSANNVTYPPCGGACRINSEILDTWRGIGPAMGEAIRRIAKQFGAKGSSILLTGHGLGGAVAVLIALDFVDSVEYKENVFRGFDLYTFGQPRIGDAGFVTYATRKLPFARQQRITHRSDPFPMRPSPADGYRHLLREVYYKGGNTTADETIWRECNDNEKTEDATCSAQHTVPKTNVTDHERYLGLSPYCVV